MRQVYANYMNWECYKNGMYCGTANRDEKQITNAKNVLSNPNFFSQIIDELLLKWPISSAVHLTNNGINRRAYLGAAACCFKFGVTEYQTRIAWGELNELQKFAANTVAENKITDFNNAQITIGF